MSCTARQCRWDFLRNPEENLSIRVRAQRGSRTGPWSAWKGVTLPVPRTTTIVDFEVKHQAVFGWLDFNGDHVVVSWDRDVDAASYKVEWRWQSFLKADFNSAWRRANPGVSPEVTADHDPLGALKQSLAILGTGGVTKFGPYSKTVGNVSQVEIENIANDGDRDDNYQLQFRVTARNSAGAAGQPSEWRSLRNVDLLKLLRSSNAKSNVCTVADVADTAITAISLYRAVAKESAAALIELAATAAAGTVAETHISGTGADRSHRTRPGARVEVDRSRQVVRCLERVLRLRRRPRRHQYRRLGEQGLARPRRCSRVPHPMSDSRHGTGGRDRRRRSVR